MLTLNRHYTELKDSYLFARIAEKTKAYLEENPEQRLLRMGIGDVSQPLCPAVIDALHAAVEDQARGETFHGYLPECGAPFFREAVAGYYRSRGVDLSPEEVFVSSGASDELGHILDLFAPESTALIPEPAYPAYVDANVMAGRKILHLPTGREQGFLPRPEGLESADLIYLCSPNNPTGAVLDREGLTAWVDFANRVGAVILFDAAYEAFVQDRDVPRSIYELSGAKECAIEICSLSKTAGFTGTRLGYTVVPADLKREGLSLRDMWAQDRTTRTNGVSYILQRGGQAALSPRGILESHPAIETCWENGRILSEALSSAGVWFTGGRNAPYLWLPCPDGMSGWAFFDHLLEAAQIAVTPGEGFGPGGSNHVRLSCFGSREDAAEAARRLRQVL